MSKYSSSGTAWEATKRRVWERDDYQCQYNFGNCSHDEDLTVDHIQAKSKGGSDELTNLITACRSCNGSKGDRGLVRLNWKDADWYKEQKY